MSTKRGDTSMTEKRGRSLSLSRKPEIGKQETTGRSPSLPGKTEIGQRRRSLNPPSFLERKKASSTSTESKKVPTIPWPSASLSRGPSARNPKKKLSPPKTKSLRRSLDRPTPPSKVMSTKSKSNPKNIIASSMKSSGLMKPKGSGTLTRSPLKLKNSVNVKATNGSIKNQTSRTTKGLGSAVMAIEKKPIISNYLSSSQKDPNIFLREENNHNIVSHEEHDHSVVAHGNNDILHGEVKCEDGGEIRVCEPSGSIGLVGDYDVLESEISCDDNVSFDGSVVDNRHTYDHNDHDINQQDQENQESEYEQVAEIGSTDESGDPKDEDMEETKQHVEYETEDPEHGETEQDEIVYEENKLEEPENEETKPDEHEETDIEEAEHEETKPDEPEDGVEVPKAEDTTSTMVVKSPEVVMHGKKDTATYNDVIEETVSKLREQRKNRVLALAGAFETVISLESDVSPKDLSPKNN